MSSVSSVSSVMKCSSGRLEDLYGIPVRILDLDLTSSGSLFEFVAERDAGVLQIRYPLVEIHGTEDDAIPASGFLALAVGHRTGP